MSFPFGDWTPDELAAQRASADQLLAVFEETSKYDTPVHDDKLRRIADRVMVRMRRACITVPEELRTGFSVGGGRDLAPVIDSAMPVWSRDVPSHTPVVLFSWKPGDRWIVRMPLRPVDLLRIVQPIGDLECEWHRGPATGEVSYLTVARGQYVIALVVCHRCRVKLDKRFSGRLKWHPTAGI